MIEEKVEEKIAEEPFIERTTRIKVPYFGGMLFFNYPFEAPGRYEEATQRVLSNNAAKLSLSDGEKTTFLLHAAYCGPRGFRDAPEMVDLRDIGQKYFWIPQINIWVPEKYPSAHGVFVIYDREGEGLAAWQEPDIGALEKAIQDGEELDNGVRFSEDRTIRFAPRNSYRGGEFRPADFARDGFIMASNGLHGARNLAEISISPYFKTRELCSWTIEPRDKIARTLSAVGGYFNGRLDFGGCHIDGKHGCALGRLECEEL